MNVYSVNMASWDFRISLEGVGIVYLVFYYNGYSDMQYYLFDEL